MDDKRFFLRPLQAADSVRMLEWLHDRTVTGFLQLNGAGLTMDDVLRFIQEAQKEDTNLHRAVVDANDTYLGTISLKNIDADMRETEYAIAMHSAAMGTGAAFAATQDILKTALGTLGLQRVYLNVLEENRRAVKFYGKCGFQYTHQSQLVLRGERRTLLWFEKRV